MQSLLQSPATPKELRFASNGRPYHSWESASGFRSPANFVLFPTKYKFHTDPAYQWICPIRDCRNLFARWEKLDEHTENTHGGLQPNDNLDGAMSVVGTWNSDYLQVISQSRPQPGTPAPAQPCLPPVRELAPSLPSGRYQTPAMHANARRSMGEATRPISACAAAVSRWEDRDVTMPVASPITVKLDAARDFHKSQQEAMAMLSSPAIGRSTQSELLSGGDDDVLIFDDDDDDDDNGSNGNSSMEQHPKMPSSQDAEIPIQSSVIYSPSSTAPSADSPKTPSTASTGLFVRPRRTSERILLQKLSQGGSTIGLDPESPRARRSMRIQGKESAAAPGAWNKRNSSSSGTKRPAPLSLASGVSLDAKAAGTATGNSWRGSPWPPSTPGNPSDSIVGTRSSYYTADGDTPLLTLGGKRRLSQLSATSDGEDGQRGSCHMSFANAGKRRGLIRMEYHSPTKGHDSDNDVAEQSNSADKDGFYPTPPSSQQTDLPLRPACKDAYLCSVGHAMEPWEISPGRLQAASTPVSSASVRDADSLRLPDIAYSAPYLAQQNPVPISPGFGAHLLYIGSGNQHHFGSDGSGGVVRERVCFVSSGKATVRINMLDGGDASTGTASLPSSRRRPESKVKGLDFGDRDQQRQKTEFEIGQGGVFMVACGTECLVTNRQYEHLVLHVVALSC